MDSKRIELILPEPVKAMYMNAKAYDDALRAGNDSFGVYAEVAAHELAAAIDKAGLEYADMMIEPFTDAVKVKIAPILAAMREEAR